MINFQTALKKGEIGENIVREYLENRGWVVYFPFTKNKAHAFDMLCTFNKEKVMAIDVKTKARLNKTPAQGIDIKSYNEYLHFKKAMNINFYLIFVDDKNGDVHFFEIGSNIDSFKINNIIFWHLKDMKFIFNIGEKNILELSKYDQRNYNFNPIE
jgi:hypothetical protein